MAQSVEQSAAEILALLTGAAQGQNQSLEAQFEAIRDALQAALGGGGGGGGASDIEAVLAEGNDANGESIEKLSSIEVGTALRASTLTYSADMARLDLGVPANGTANIQVVGAGGQLFVRAADGDATHVGGELSIISGDSDGQSGGQLNIIAGSDGADGDGGPIWVQAGATSGEGDGGDLDLIAGIANGTGGGGDASLSGGPAGDGDGGRVQIMGGYSSAGLPGAVEIYDGSGMHSITLNDSGIALSAVVVTSLPAVDPNVAGALYLVADADRAAAVAAGSRFLMVSNGP